MNQPKMKFMRRVHTAYGHVYKTVGLIPAGVIEMLKNEGLSSSKSIARLVWDVLSPEQQTDMFWVDGLVGGVPHEWFELRLSTELASEPNFKYIIDPCCPDVYPGVLLVSPRSPYTMAYKATEVKDKGYHTDFSD